MNLIPEDLTEEEEIELLELLEQEERERVAPKFEAWREAARYKIAYGGRGAGAKSWSAASLIVQEAEQRGIKVACLRETMKSLEESVYSLVQNTVDRLQYDEWRFTKEYVENSKNGSHFIFRGLKDLRASNQIKSLEGYDIFFVEEAATISNESWSILLPTLRKAGSELWAVFNREEEMDPVYERFVVNERKNSIILHLQPGPIDNPWWNETTLPQEMEEDFKYDEDEAVHIWHGEPRKQGFKAILSRAKIRQAMDRNIVDPEGQISIGCDPADFGDDKTQIYKKKGLKIIGHKYIAMSDGIEVANTIGSMINRDPSIPVRIDTTGIGTSARDQSVQLGLKVKPINFAESANDKDKYADIVTEMWFHLRDIIDEIDIPDDPELMRELAGRQYDYDSKGRYKIESKKEFKKRYGKSPDKADALILPFFNKDGGGNVSSSAAAAIAARRRR
jgi:phage terminase large subunit